MHEQLWIGVVGSQTFSHSLKFQDGGPLGSDPGLQLPAPCASTAVVSKRDLYKSSPMNARTLKKYILQALESTYLL